MHQRAKYIEISPPSVIQPTKAQVSKESLQVYKDYVAMSHKLVISVNPDSVKTYQDYVKSRQCL